MNHPLIHRQRASLVLIQQQRLLAIRRENERGLYYVFPGGGIEEGETPQQAVVRETREEAGIEVLAGQVLFATDNEYDHNQFVLCQQVGDEEPLWQEVHKQTATDTYVFEWLPLVDLGEYPLLPPEGRDQILCLAGEGRF